MRDAHFGFFTCSCVHSLQKCVAGHLASEIDVVEYDRPHQRRFARENVLIQAVGCSC